MMDLNSVELSCFLYLILENNLELTGYKRVSLTQLNYVKTKNIITWLYDVLYILLYHIFIITNK